MKRIGQADGLDCRFSGWLVAAEDEVPYIATDITPADWRAGAAALSFLAARVTAAGDRPNGGRLKDLANKAETITLWREGFLRVMDDLKKASAEARGA